MADKPISPMPVRPFKQISMVIEDDEQEAVDAEVSQVPPSRFAALSPMQAFKRISSKMGRNSSCDSIATPKPDQADQADETKVVEATAVEAMLVPQPPIAPAAVGAGRRAFGLFSCCAVEAPHPTGPPPAVMSQ